MAIGRSLRSGVQEVLEQRLQLEHRRTQIRELMINITRGCTDRCSKCVVWQQAETAAERCPIEKFEQCIRDLAPRLDAVGLAGGEPLMLRDGVLRLGAVCAELDLPMVVVTNGVLADAAFLDAYAALGHRLIISADTLDPQRWSAFRGRDNHAVVFGNIEHARRVLGDRLTIQSVLARETVDDVRELAAFCADANIRHVEQPYVDTGGSWSRLRSRVPDLTPCEAWRNVCVYPNGDVVRCFDHLRIPMAREPLGNLTTESIEAILAKPRTRAVTRRMQRCWQSCRRYTCNRSRESRPMQVVRGALQTLESVRRG